MEGQACKSTWKWMTYAVLSAEVALGTVEPALP